MDINLSYIIVTYNSAKYISNCLHSILSQKSDEIRSEVIVIDNDSKDETVDFIKEKFPQVVCKKNNNNVGFAVAVNQAASISKGKYILLLNPDTVLSDNFIVSLFSFVNKTTDASVVGVKIVDDRFTHQPSVWKKPSFFTILAEMLLPYSLSIKIVTLSPDKPTLVENVSGACMLIKRDVFQKLDGFDEGFFLYYEEIDFCKRAKQAGYKIYYNPNISVVHYATKSSFNEPEIFFYNLYKNKLRFIRKHYKNSFYIVSYVVVLTGIILRTLVAFLAGVFSLNKNLIKLSRSLIFALIKIIRG